MKIIFVKGSTAYNLLVRFGYSLVTHKRKTFIITLVDLIYQAIITQQLNVMFLT